MSDSCGKRMKIHWTVNGVPDSMVLVGAVEEIREQAARELERRGADAGSEWSEPLRPTEPEEEDHA